jgi:hypothetical protein
VAVEEEGTDGDRHRDGGGGEGAGLMTVGGRGLFCLRHPHSWR